MSRLDLAVARLTAALETLDFHVRERIESSCGATEWEAERDTVSTERDALAARIVELEEEARVLAGLTSEVEGRLDGAIAEIRQVLGQN